MKPTLLKQVHLGCFCCKCVKVHRTNLRGSLFTKWGYQENERYLDFFVKRFKIKIKKGMDKESLKSLFQKSDLYTENFKLKEDFDQLKKTISENLPKVSFLRIL